MFLVKSQYTPQVLVNIMVSTSTLPCFGANKVGAPNHSQVVEHNFNIYGLLIFIVLLTSSSYSIHGVNQQTQLDFPPNLQPCFLLQDGEPPKRKKRRIPSSTVGFFVPTVDFIKWAWTYQKSCWKVKPPEKAG